MYVQVTGEADEKQLCEALRRYRDRECFVREALVHLYNLTLDSDKLRPEVLKVNCCFFYCSLVEKTFQCLHSGVSVAVGCGRDAEPPRESARPPGGDSVRVEPHHPEHGRGHVRRPDRLRRHPAAAQHEDLPQPEAGEGTSIRDQMIPHVHRQTTGRESGGVGFLTAGYRISQ